MSATTVALCGAGMISHAHAAAARHLGMSVVAVASRSSERRETRSRELGARPVEYANLPAGAEIVVVATPPAQHFEHVVHNLERGASVIVEKPLVTTLNEADRLVMISERHANRVLYAENLAYAPAFRRWISLVSELGTVEHMSARMEQGAPTWGDFLEPSWGGGVLFDLGVHPLALLVLSARAAAWGEVISVSATFDGDATDEIADVVLRFAAGRTAQLHVSWRGSDPPHWGMQVASPTGALTLELMPEVQLERNGEQVPLPRATTVPSMLETLGYVDQVRAFRSDLDERTTPWMSVAFGRWILEIVCACSVSAASDGRSTPVPSGCDRSRTPWQLWRAQATE